MSEKVKDLVCGMEFDEHTSSGVFVHKDKTYYFCSLGCKKKFMEEPEKYAAHEKKLKETEDKG